MKIISYGVAVLLFSGVSFAQQYQASFRVRILDEAGFPVTNATVYAGYWKNNASYSGKEIGEKYTKQTDSNGVCAFIGKCNGSVGWKVEKAGYYCTYGPEPRFTNLTSQGILEPENLVYEATLRKIKNPTPMYMRDLKQLWPPITVPELGKAFGFDLMKSDWVAPYGKGVDVDFLIRVNSEKTVMSPDYLAKNPESDSQAWHCAYSLTFPNPDDGIQQFCEPHHGGSVFRLPRLAPEGGYETNFFREYRVGAGAVRNDEMQREDLNYLFRVRTKRDANGKLVSALYGKIEGRIEYGDKWFSFFYFLNPTPNDRNLEHDPKRNLFQAK